MSKEQPGASKLLHIGMEDAAQWMLDEKMLRHVGDTAPHWRYLTAIPNSLYAFVCDGEVLNQAIMKLIRQKKEVRILVLPPRVPLKWGDYPINLAAGLEDALVEAFKPEWNKIKGRILSESQAVEESAS